MNINLDHKSAAKRRLVIALTIIPFTVFVAADAARVAVRNMWRGAAAGWRA